MNTSNEGEIFFGPVSDEELQLRYSRRSLCSRKTECFITAKQINISLGNLSCQDTIEYDRTAFNPLEETCESEKSDMNFTNSYLEHRQNTDEGKLEIASISRKNVEMSSRIKLSPSASQCAKKSSFPEVEPQNASFYPVEMDLNFTNLSMQNEDNKVHSISGESCIPPTPCNSTLEHIEKPWEVSSPKCQSIMPTSRISLESGNLIRNSKFDRNCFSKDVMDSIDHTSMNFHQKEPKCGDNTEDDLVSPTPYNSATQYDDCSDFNKDDYNSKIVMGNDMEIITICSSDETNYGLQIDEALDSKENISLTSRNISSVTPKNQFQVPEMTKKQQDMLRQLWMSPQSESMDSVSGSPLMNALDLSIANDHTMVSQRNAKSSIATLDLTVDERIPVMNYMSNFINPSIHRNEDNQVNITNEVENNSSPLKVKKTPMKVISHKIGVVNVISSSEKKKCLTSSKKTILTPKLSNIPVPQVDHTRESRPDFKKPLLYHGITTYKSKVSGLPQRFFPSPCVSKKWNVASPVAKYINEDPAQPLEKIVRSKELKELPTKNQKCGIPSLSVTPSPHAKVPVAHYKLKHGKIPIHESAGVSSAQQRMRLFPSPFTPKLVKHEGPGKGIKGATCLKPVQTNLSESKGNATNSSDLSMNKSIIKTIVSQRTNTLFKPLD